MVVCVRCDALCVKGENMVVHCYAGSQIHCFMVHSFAGTWFHRVVNLFALRVQIALSSPEWSGADATEEVVDPMMCLLSLYIQM